MSLDVWKMHKLKLKGTRSTSAQLFLNPELVHQIKENAKNRPKCFTNKIPNDFNMWDFTMYSIILTYSIKQNQNICTDKQIKSEKQTLMHNFMCVFADLSGHTVLGVYSVHCR